MIRCFVSCFLFVGFLTSLLQGKKIDASKLNKLPNSEDVFISFGSSKMFSDPLKDGDVAEEIKELEPNVTYYFHIENVPTYANFIVFQTHAYLHNVTLGYNVEKEANRYVTGQNIGLVQNVTGKGTLNFFVENSNAFNVSVLIAAVPYNKSVPVPGGCNMEFEVETAPWLRVNVTGPAVVVSSQPAKPPRVSGLGDVCDMPSLRYQAYHLYLPEKDFLVDTYFAYISSMLTVKRIQQNGRKVKDAIEGRMRHMYSAYHGTGTVFAVVVTDTAHSAAYVPALTYSCSPAHYTDTCQVLTSMFSRCLCALVLFLGLFVCLYGHSFFQTELFLFTTLMGSIFFYVLVAPLKLTDATNVMLATVGGVTVGNFWLVLWWASGSPMLSLIMATLSLGYLLTCVLFYSALADLPMFESNVNFWLAFICGVLVVALLVGPQTTRVNLLACSIVGSYAAVVPIDHYIGANLKYIFINTMRRATVPDFDQAIIDPPFQTKDAVLATFWVVLAVVGYAMQAQRFSDRPMFPPHHPHLWDFTPTHRPSADPHSETKPLLSNSPTPVSDNVFT